MIKTKGKRSTAVGSNNTNAPNLNPDVSVSWINFIDNNSTFQGEFQLVNNTNSFQSWKVLFTNVINWSITNISQANATSSTLEILVNGTSNLNPGEQRNITFTGTTGQTSGQTPNVFPFTLFSVL